MGHGSQLMPETVRTTDAARVPRNAVCELEFTAARDVDDPFADIQLDVEFTDPNGTRRTVPAFWNGARAWRVRYSSPVEGRHGYRSVVTGPDGTGLDALTGEVTVVGYDGANPLLVHGAPVVAADRRHLAHADGTPFLWLADTWWSAMTARFRWPDVFEELAADRHAKGFNVIQLVAGLVPEFPPFAPEMASEGGQPWTDGGAGEINPDYWTVPDLKIDHLVGLGMVPCIFGAWGYWADVLGRERTLRHWRYVVARYAAYPVVWCIAGEVDLARLHGDQRQDGEQLRARAARQVELWEDASRLVRQIDPFARVRTVHPTPAPPTWSYASGDTFASRESFELEMLQTGHTGRNCITPTMEHLTTALAHGDKPVINGECSYEGILGSSWQDVQRFLFWSHMLSGTAGHTYGTMPISTFNSREDPWVPNSRVSMHFWEDAIDWPGATHVGVGRRILERLPWWELEASPASFEPHAGPDDWQLPYAGRLADGTLVVYLPGIGMLGANDWTALSSWTVCGLTPGASYRAVYVDPRTGVEHSGFTFHAADARYTHELGYSWNTPTGEDWVMIVQPAEQPAH
jgi:hypothetical protein